jgi:hypothetical protein
MRRSMRRLGLGLVVGVMALLAVAGPAAAQSQEEVAKQLRVEWEPLEETWTRPRLGGYVYNDSTYRIGSVRLRIEVLDASQQVVRQELAWIYVHIPARDRASFAVRRPPGEAFRITVESFVLIARESTGETP